MTISLFDQPPFQAHSTTSLAAAEAIKPDASTLRERVYRCILALGPVTDQEIQTHLAMDPSTERPRRIELVRAGRVVRSGTRKTYSGRDAAAWIAAR